MDATPILELPFPEPDDAPNGPAQIQALAEKIEPILTGVFDQNLFASSAPVGAYAALANSPSITIPTAGTWEVNFGGRVETGSVAGSATIVGLKLGAAAIVDPDEVQVSSGNATFLTATVARTVQAVIAAGTVLTLQGRASGSDGNVDDLYISARLVAA